MHEETTSSNKIDTLVTFVGVREYLVVNFLEPYIYSRDNSVHKIVLLSGEFNKEDESELQKKSIEIIEGKKKTVKISNSKNKESITTAFQIKGKIFGSDEALSILYYKGLGSKTSLGLGCWRQLNESQ